jgi:hypothetical protein
VLHVARIISFSLAAGVMASQPAGDPGAFADRLLESLGGRKVWADARTLYVKERAYPPNVAGPVSAEFWRDLHVPAYRSVVIGPGFRRETHWSEAGGWRIRDGVRTEMTPAELATEVADWRTEPYVLYHQIAVRDPRLRLALNGERRLDVFDASSSGALIGWFVTDSAGALLKWGNYYEGAVSEHVYGPLQAFGAFRMPRWGAATDGSWRFEYDVVRATREPLVIGPGRGRP